MKLFCAALRVNDATAAAKFYVDHLACVQLYAGSEFAPPGMTRAVVLATPLSTDASTTQEGAEDALRNFPGQGFMLVEDPALQGRRPNHGNAEPHRGFGHLAFLVPDLEGCCQTLDAAGVTFVKRPHEGKMRNIAFVEDLDGYRVEIIARPPDAPQFERSISFAHSMIRVKDAQKSLKFYQEFLGLKLARESPQSDFSLYFLNSSGENPYHSWWPALELTHNHGTENDANFRYHSGNTEPVGFYGFGLIRVSNSAAGCEEMRQKGERAGGMREGSEFITDPDGYRCFLIC